MAVSRKSFTVFTALLLLVAALCGSYTASAGSPKAHASHILVDSEEQADELLAEINQSKNVFVPFAKLAMAHSKCPSSKKGGDLGTFGQGQMVPEFDRVVFTEKIGVVHKVKTQFGWHLVLISTRSDGSEVSESETYKMFRDFLLKASPFLGPILLVVIMYFGSRSSAKTAGPKARSSHILVKTEAEADALYKEISAAADPLKKLAELAAKKSQCPSGRKGGDLGLFGRGQMVPAFDKVVFEEEVGKVHKIQTQFGWHVLICSERFGGVEPKKIDEKKTNVCWLVKLTERRHTILEIGLAVFGGVGIEVVHTRARRGEHQVPSELGKFIKAHSHNNMSPPSYSYNHTCQKWYLCTHLRAHFVHDAHRLLEHDLVELLNHLTAAERAERTAAAARRTLTLALGEFRELGRQVVGGLDLREQLVHLRFRGHKDVARAGRRRVSRRDGRHDGHEHRHERKERHPHVLLRHLALLCLLSVVRASWVLRGHVCAMQCPLVKKPICSFKGIPNYDLRDADLVWDADEVTHQHQQRAGIFLERELLVSCSLEFGTRGRHYDSPVLAAAGVAKAPTIPEQLIANYYRS